jgi:hypothetical protein
MAEMAKCGHLPLSAGKIWRLWAKVSAPAADKGLERGANAPSSQLIAFSYARTARQTTLGNG